MSLHAEVRPAAASRVVDRLPPGVIPDRRTSVWRFELRVRAIDLWIVILTSAISYVFFVDKSYAVPDVYIAATLIGTILTHVTLGRFGAYDFSALASFRSAIRTIFPAWSLVFLGLSLMVFFLRPTGGISRGWSISWYLTGLVALHGWRFWATRMHQNDVRHGKIRHTILLVGGTDLSGALIRHLRGNPFGISIIGYFDDRTRDNVTVIEGVPKIGSVQDLLDFVAHHDVDEVIITLPFDATARIAEILRSLRQQPLNVRILPGMSALDHNIIGSGLSWHIPGVLLFPLINRPISTAGLIAKTMMDKVVASIALVIFSAPMLCAALAIKLSSPGPVLFRQKRMGYKNREFEILKFRTMAHRRADEAKLVLTQKNDPRVFKLGAILRRSSFDELPQLLNVLRGDMSIVGPRPHALTARAEDVLYHEAVADYATRHRVKPGITGWAQVNGWRGPTDTLAQIQKRVEHDLYYIDNWTIALDLWIVFLTVFKGFGGRNAY